VVDDPWNTELVRVGNQVFRNQAEAEAAGAMTPTAATTERQRRELPKL